MEPLPTPGLTPRQLLTFPSLAVRVRDLRRLLASGAPARRVREQVSMLKREHRRRLTQALRALHSLKPLCAPELRSLWMDTIDSAILLLHLNAREFRDALGSLSDPPPRRPAGRT